MLPTTAEAWTALAEEAEYRENFEELIEHKSNAPSVLRCNRPPRFSGSSTAKLMLSNEPEVIMLEHKVKKFFGRLLHFGFASGLFVLAAMQ